ncbi:DUF3369 domain-containing protein [Vibrio sp. Of7-15]|uniref:DUF3369 domain-containing protein n=1 Tax=Vibrio sp. Of7-15 TaxID=2724879 RepID=UPI001EF3B82E|nr:HD domain-containing phosphohydrolase [Vibrio sp. Of7-15]MCG7496215.1 DUF3369 domain-containing protein [Vibrio sp. Of7-15]
MSLSLLRDLEEESLPPWKILIVDDEPDIHQVTKMVLKRFKFDNRPLEFHDAFSGEEAKEQLSNTSDFALVFLDVVMETDDAGLEVARWMRQELDNHRTRIVLRTGQPGQAPEHKVITEYDINDYREKTELDSKKLFSTVYTSLRSYRDIINVEEARQQEESYRHGLERVIQSTSEIFKQSTLTSFSSGVLQQVLSLLRMNDQSMLVRVKGIATLQDEKNDYQILAQIGADDTEEAIDEEIQRFLERALKEKKSIIEDDIFVGYFSTKSGAISLLYLKGARKITDLECQLLNIFSSSVSMSFENLLLNKEIIDTQGELIYRLGDVVESRSQEAGNHVRRIANLGYHLCKLLGCSEERAQLIKQSSPMHDIGKIATPDAILLKPGKLDPEEWEIMKEHSEIGYNILSGSKRPILQTAAIIAHQHHEKYDGTGYPQGLKGEEISLEARIIAVVDVFDALTHARCYKPAWPIEDVITLLRDSRGTHLDPLIVDTLLNNIDLALAINEQYSH